MVFDDWGYLDERDMTQIKHLTLNVENTMVKRNVQMPLEPVETVDKIVMVG